MKFYICKHCGNIVTMVEDKNVPLTCCGEKMEELVANTTDAANEKHVPVVNREGNKVIVNVGSVAHPMSEEHNISWIALETKKGMCQFRKLDVTGEPKQCFHICENDEVENVYAYCNLHGLWSNK